MTVLVTAGDQRSSLAVARSLGRRGIKVIVGETHKKCLTSYSRYVQESFVYPLEDSNKADFVRAVIDIARSNGVELIIPTTDATVAALSEHSEEVEAVSRLACPPYSSVCIAIDKKKTLDLAKSLDIPTPKTEFIGNLDSLKEAAERLGFPIVIKPTRKKHFNDDEGHNFVVEYVNTLDALRERLAHHKENGPLPMLQEYCRGAGVGIEVLMSEGEPLALFQHRRIREMPASGGVSVLCESVPVNPILKEYAVKLLRAMKWEGAAMVEFRVDEKTNQPKLMEVNGRFWGSLALPIQAGVDFPYLHYELFLNSRRIRVNSYRTNFKCQYRRGDLERLIDIMRNLNENPVEALPSKKQTIFDFMLSTFDRRVGDLVLSRDDILPGAVDLIRLFTEGLQRAFIKLFIRKLNMTSPKRIRGIIHVHSNYSYDGTATLDAIISEARRFGYRFVAITEHAENLDEDTMVKFVAHCESLNTSDLMVIPGIEVRCDNGTHLLAINVRKCIESASVAEVAKKIKDYGGICIVAHPLENGHDLNAEEIKCMDGMEIWNAGRRSGLTIPKLGQMGILRRLRNHNKNMYLYSGLDLHELREMKSFWIEAPAYCKNETELLEAFRSGKFFTTNGIISVSSSGYLSVKGINARSFLKAPIVLKEFCRKLFSLTFKQFIKKIVRKGLYLLKAHELFRFLNRNKVAVIMYHGVVEKELSPFAWTQMPLQKFEQQIEYISKKYHVLPLTTVVEKLINNEKLPEYSLAITFDDGLKNNCLTAFPVLKRFNLPATIFLTTCNIGSDRLLWFDRLYLAVKETKKTGVDLNEEGLGFFSTSTLEEKNQTLLALTNHMKGLQRNEKDLLLNKVLNKLGVGSAEVQDANPFKGLDWDEIISMSQSKLISFGAHTETHNIMTRITKEEVLQEIEISKKKIEEKLKTPCLLFAFPNGQREDFNNEIKDAVKNSGFLCSFTTIAKFNESCTDPFELGRFPIGSECDEKYFKLLISGTIAFLSKIANRFRKG